jgi:hypothetical protein
LLRVARIAPLFLEPREEIVGHSTTRRPSQREIHLLTTEARLVDIKYDADTVSYNKKKIAGGMLHATTI